jgi:YbgC/YbaW family acyl-CoA thioester hydrolase
MYSSETLIRVRYGETDRMGYMYYGHYPEYFEVSRTDMIRSLGLSYKEIEDLGIIMPVRSLNVHYKLPAHYDERYLKSNLISTTKYIINNNNLFAPAIPYWPLLTPKHAVHDGLLIFFWKR